MASRAGHLGPGAGYKHLRQRKLRHKQTALQTLLCWHTSRKATRHWTRPGIAVGIGTQFTKMLPEPWHRLQQSAPPPLSNPRLSPSQVQQLSARTLRRLTILRPSLQREKRAKARLMADVLAREAAARRRIVEQVYRDPRTGFGSIANTLKAAKARNPFVSRDEVKQFFETLRDRQDRPQRGYNSFVPQCLRSRCTRCRWI